MSALEHLGKVSAEYAKAAQAFGQIALDAANAEADHRRARAQTILRAKAGEERISHAEAEARAEADETVSGLYRQRVTTAAVADAAKERLRQLKSQVEVGRSFASTERAGDQFAATGGGP